MKTLPYPTVLRGAVSFLVICAALIHFGPRVCPAAETHEVAAAYVEGIETLETGDFKKAEGDFTRALQADGDNEDYLRARGVAGVLAENFQAAIADLERAIRLQPSDSEAKLWLASAYRMSGNPEKGSMLFSFNDIPHNYADMIYNVLAMDYWSSATRGTYFDRVSHKDVSVKSPVKTLFPDAAGAYAERHRASGATANQFVVERMKKALSKGDWGAAWTDLVSLRRTVPDDPSLRGYGAQCLLGFGDALHAREEFTRVLSALPLWGEGYLGRAKAEAMIGDFRRAHSDLDIASSLKVKTDGAKSEIKHIGEPEGDRAIEGLEKQIFTTGSPWESLVNSSLALHRSFNMKRLRYDESYQDRIYAISDAIQAEPKNADRHELLGRFLFDFYAVPTVWNGPRAISQLRPQDDYEKKGELTRALAAADAALKIAPRHVNALTTKALILYRIGHSGEAETLVDEALKYGPHNARALFLKAQILRDRASELAGRAAALRSGHSESHTEQRSDGEYEVTTHYPPTAEELAEAAQAEAQAAVLTHQAEGLETEANHVRNKVVPDLLKKKQAEKAEALDPDRDDVNRALADSARWHHDGRMERVYTLLAEPLAYTSDAGEMKTAWENIMRTAWKAAEDSLDSASRIDPTDARIPAYRSVIAQARENMQGATDQRSGALALEEARARLMGTSFVAVTPAPLQVSEAGLAMITREKQGDSLMKTGQLNRAAEEYSANLTIEKRAGRNDLWMLIPTAMLPDPMSASRDVPNAPTLASLMAESKLGLARTLLAMNRTADAEQQFLAVRSYLAKWPATAENRESMNVVDSWARLGLAESALKAGNIDQARQLLMSGEGFPWGLPQDLEAKKRELTNQVQSANDQAWQRQAEAERQMTPQQRMDRYQQNENDQFQQQRASMEKELQDPNLRPADRRALESSLAELDRTMNARGNRNSRSR